MSPDPVQQDELKELPRPTAGRYLIQRDTPADRAGIFEIPPNCQKQPMSGVVLRAGAPLPGQAVTAAQAGDRVLFPLRSWETIYRAGELLLVVPESSLLAIVD